MSKANLSKAAVTALGLLVSLGVVAAQASAQNAGKVSISNEELEAALKGQLLGEGAFRVTLADGSDGSGAGPTVCNSCLVGDVNCNSTVGGNLSAADCGIAGLLGPGHQTFIEAHRLVLTQDSGVRIDQTSDVGGFGFDSILILADASCTIIAANDDCGGVCCNSCLDVVLPAGTYFLAAASFDNLDTGDYQLSVRCVPIPPVPASTPWSLLAGVAVLLAGGTLVLARKLRPAAVSQ